MVNDEMMQSTFAIAIHKCFHNTLSWGPIDSKKIKDHDQFIMVWFRIFACVITWINDDFLWIGFRKTNQENALEKVPCNMVVIYSGANK